MEGGDNQDKNTGVNEGRRRLSKAALASPIIASLSTRPVWGTTCSISGLQSGNTSQPGKDECEGSGCTPGFWKNSPEAWLINTPYVPGICLTVDPNTGLCQEWNGGAPGTTFNEAFGGVGPTDTMMDILLKTKATAATSPGAFNTQLNHYVAALLNASASPFTYGADPADVIAAVQAAFSGAPFFNDGSPISHEELKELFRKMNEAGGSDHCIFNNHGYCDDNHVNVNGECIPACGDGTQFDYCTQTCSENPKLTLTEVYAGVDSDGKPVTLPYPCQCDDSCT